VVAAYLRAPLHQSQLPAAVDRAGCQRSGRLVLAVLVYSLLLERTDHRTQSVGLAVLWQALPTTFKHPQRA
jgi:hypothetical protein